MQMEANLSGPCAQRRPLGRMDTQNGLVPPTTEASELPSISLINLFFPLCFLTWSPRKCVTNGSSFTNRNEVCETRHLAPARLRAFSQPSGITHADTA